MAKFETVGLEATIKALSVEGIYDDDTQNELLYAGADVLVDCIKDEMSKSTFNLSRIMPNVKYSKAIKTDKRGDKYVTVSVAGKNEHGVSNALITFVLNYGRQKKWGEIIGQHFWTRGKQKGAELSRQAMTDLANKKLNEKGLT